jgi:hypothetical protein
LRPLGSINAPYFVGDAINFMLIGRDQDEQAERLAKHVIPSVRSAAWLGDGLVTSTAVLRDVPGSGRRAKRVAVVPVSSCVSSEHE